LNGDPVIPGEVTISSTPTPELTVNPDGTVTVAPGTPAGTYYIDYTICENLNPTNCDQAEVMVVVEAALIVANDDLGSEVNGTLGGVSYANVLDNDELNNVLVNPAEVTMTEISSTHPGVTLNPLTGEVIVAPGTPADTYYLVYEICENLNPTNCDQATVTVPVWEEPSGLFCFNGETAVSGSSFTYCSTETVTVTLCDILTGVAPFDICWELNGVPDCKNDVDLNDPLFSDMLPPGVYNIQITSIIDAEGHSASDVSMYYATVTIITSPDVFAGDDDVVCIEGSYTLSSATASNFSSLEWTGGDGNFTPSANALNPTYEPGTQDKLEGVITLCLTAQPKDPCTLSASDCMDLTIQPLPVADAGIDQTVCDNVSFIDVSGSAVNASGVLWTSSGNGFFDMDDVAVTQYFLSQDDIDNGTVNLCFRAIAMDPCTGYDEACITITIDASPTADAGSSATICEGEAHTLSDAFASDYTGLSWSGGDGIFLPGNDVMNPTYEPGPLDISNGSVVLCMTAQPVGLCPDPETNCMVLTIVGNPTVELGPDYNLDCADYDVDAGEWSPVEITADLTNVENVLWTTSNGDGYFEDPTAVPGIYHMGVNDIWRGDIEICIEVLGAGSCQVTDSDCITVYAPQQLIYFDKDAWWGVSSYLDPDLTTVPEVMDPLVLIPGSQHLVTMINKQGKYFWPEPTPPTNIIGDWSPVGYKIKTKNSPSCLWIFGDTLIDQTFEIDGPFTYLPVLTNVPVDINSLFGSHVSDILLIFDWPTGELWTPFASDFDELMPGRAYLLVNRNGSGSYTIEFPDFDPYAPHLYPTAKDNVVQNNSPWNDVVNTSQPHILLFADEALGELEAGDIIGTFNENDECFGMAEYESVDSFYKLIAMGNNPFSKHTDGFKVDELMRFKLYRPSLGWAVDVSLEFDPEYPNYNGLYAENGASRVVGLSMTITSVGDLNKGYNVSVYPNPAIEMLSISSEQEMSSVTVLDHIGQSIMQRDVRGKTYQINVSVFSAGMYFLRIETTDGNVITKRIIIE